MIRFLLVPAAVVVGSMLLLEVLAAKESLLDLRRRLPEVVTFVSANTELNCPSPQLIAQY